MSSFPEQYYKFVGALSKPGEEIVQSLTADKAHVLHMLLGLTGEVGELVDAIKKHIIYGKVLDIAHVVEELGDIEFYLQGLRNAYEISRISVVLQNERKLQQRYAAGRYTNQQAVQRADKSAVDSAGT